jgi:hypothetical protein
MRLLQWAALRRDREQYWPSILGWLRGKRKRKEDGRLEQGDWRAADPSLHAFCEKTDWEWLHNSKFYNLNYKYLLT